MAHQETRESHGEPGITSCHRYNFCPWSAAKVRWSRQLPLRVMPATPIVVIEEDSGGIPNDVMFTPFHRDSLWRTRKWMRTTRTVQRLKSSAGYSWPGWRNSAVTTNRLSVGKRRLTSGWPSRRAASTQTQLIPARHGHIDLLRRRTNFNLAAHIQKPGQPSACVSRPHASASGSSRRSTAWLTAAKGDHVSGSSKAARDLPGPREPRLRASSEIAAGGASTCMVAVGST